MTPAMQGRATAVETRRKGVDADERARPPAQRARGKQLYDGRVKKVRNLGDARAALRGGQRLIARHRPPFANRDDGIGSAGSD